MPPVFVAVRVNINHMLSEKDLAVDGMPESAAPLYEGVNGTGGVSKPADAAEQLHHPLVAEPEADHDYAPVSEQALKLLENA
jgi:hypothetical protein